MRGLSVVLAAGACVGVGEVARAADSTWNVNGGTWTTAADWLPVGVPGTGAVADIFLPNGACFYNYTTTVNSAVLSGVQVADTSTMLISTSGATLQLGYLEIGGTNTGLIPGSKNISGAGHVTQSYGTVSFTGALNVDSSSTYSLSSSGVISASGPETLAGTFTQAGGNNSVSPGVSIINSGTYTISNTGSGIITCASFLNSGSFNQTGGTFEGSLAGSTGTGNFNNSGQYYYTVGNFYGVMQNFGLCAVTSGNVPFAQGILNDGLLTINGATGTYASPISSNTGSGYITLKGSTTNLTLSGNNAYSGVTDIEAGILSLASPIGTAANNYGGSLQGPINVSTSATLISNASDQIANTVALTINGGLYNLNGYDESVGALIMNGGAIQQSNSSFALGVATGQVSITGPSATITGGLRSATTFNFNVSSSSTLSVIGPIGGYNSSSQGMILVGGGTLFFSANSPLSTIDVKSGMLELLESGSLGNVNSLVTLEAGSSLALNNQSMTIGNLNGSSDSAISLGTGTLTITSNVSAGTIYGGTINGTGSLTKAGQGSLTLSGNDLATGNLTVTAGLLTLSSTSTSATTNITVSELATCNISGSITSVPTITTNGVVNLASNSTSGISDQNVGAITIGSTPASTGQFNVSYSSPHIARTLLLTSSLTISGTTNAWVGQLDLANNDAIVHFGYLPQINNQVASGYNGAGGGLWNGPGITSSAAANDSTHMTALGVIVNNIGGGTPLYGFGGSLGLFDGYNAASTDVLIKYTYYGDANLDGQVDGSDYALLDNGFTNNLTGWYNGDFNYDGVINGSDYALIDNSFNTQGNNLTASAEVAAITAEIASISTGGSAAVPEPAAITLLGASLISLLGHRRKRGLSNPNN